MTTPRMTPRILVAVILAAIAVSSPLIAQRVAEPELLLREALHKQQVEGDLPGAIKIYHQIVSAKSSNRAVTARALLELAGCYEKLGQQAHTVYQQIVRDFSEQPAAAQARARLAALRPPAPAPTMTLRRLEVVNGMKRIVVTDGQRALFGDGPRIFIGDLAGTEKRLVTEQQPAFGVTSRDLSVGLAWRSRTQQVSIIRTDGSAERVLDLRENGRPLVVNWPGPLSGDWSWDNRYVLLTLPGEEGSRLTKITVADGSVTDALPGRRGIREARFSPDGQFIAYFEGLYRGPISVAPANGGESHLIATEARLVDWTHDGRYVLTREFTDRGFVLRAVPVQHGRKQGEPIVLRTIPGPGARTMMNGSLFVTSADPANEVRDTWLGILDEGDASITWTSQNLVGSPVSNRFNAWAPDGTVFAYVTGDKLTKAVRVKDTVSGDDRELYRGEGLIGCVAAHREAVLFCARVFGSGLQVVSVSLDSGRTEIRGTPRRHEMVVHMTADDRKIVFYDDATNGHVAWDIATGEERPLRGYPSHDARWNLNDSVDASQGHAVSVRPAAGESDWRLLVTRRMPLPGNSAIPVRFSPDGNWVVYHDRDAAGKNGLYRIATAGGEPQRLGDYPTGQSTSLLSISRDGRRFIVHAPKPPAQQKGQEYWVLENFLPTEKAPTTATAKKNGK